MAVKRLTALCRNCKKACWRTAGRDQSLCRDCHDLTSEINPTTVNSERAPSQ